MKLSPQNHFYFSKSFLTNTISSPCKYLWQKFFKFPQAFIFSYPLPFQNVGLKFLPSAERWGLILCSVNVGVHQCIFLLYERFKASCSDVCFSVANFVRLTSIFEELFISEMGRNKREWMIKQSRKPLSFLGRTVIGTCYCK